MPRTASQNASVRAASRQRLIEAALTLFAEHGYAGTSVRAIAEHAGVATGLLYQHFEGKEALLRAIFERSMDDVRASFAMAEGAAPTERLRALVVGALAIVRSNLEFWRLSYAARTQSAVRLALGPALGEWTDVIVATLRVIVEEAGSDAPELDARALFAQIDGLCQHFVLDPVGYPADEVVERIVARWGTP